jgi:hypothetical protein
MTQNYLALREGKAAQSRMNDTFSGVISTALLLSVSF